MQEAVTLHYRSVFDLTPVEDADDPTWSEVIRPIRFWIERKENAEKELAKPWFYTGGIWNAGRRRDRLVETRSESGKYDDRAPQFWSIRYEHPCGSFGFRRWRTDIGVERISEDEYRVSVAVSHWIKSDYVGIEPDPPTASAPGIVFMLIGPSSLWEASAGSEVLSNIPRTIVAGEADILQSRLTADDRNCPIVLISEEYKTSKFLLDPRKLARLLTGAAVVYAPEAGYNYKELEWMISRGFRCWNGMVRIYQPGVDFQNQQDALRHRYFPREKIEELGPDRVSDIIVRAVSRRRAFDRNAVTTIYDVDSRRRAAKLEMLRMDSGEASPDELREQVELLEDEVSRLVDVNEDLRKESAYAFEEGQRLETQYAEIQDELRTTRYKAESFETSSEELRERLAILQRRTSALDALETLPDSVFSAAKLIEKIHADKIVFLDEAYESAKEAGINNSASDLAKVWRALWAVSTTLHQLLFDPDEKSILKAFQSQTSFDLSMAAGAQTKKDSKLMALRKRNYKGREVDISPHVGFGNKPPRLLRIYFYADHGDQKIVVGHCGDHLDNFTTKSMS